MAEQKEYTDLDMNGQNINQLTAVYFGDPNVNGTWRIYLSGNVLLVERLEDNEWKAKDSFHP